MKTFKNALGIKSKKEKTSISASSASETTIDPNASSVKVNVADLSSPSAIAISSHDNSTLDLASLAGALPVPTVVAPSPHFTTAAAASVVAANHSNTTSHEPASPQTDGSSPLVFTPATMGSTRSTTAVSSPETDPRSPQYAGMEIQRTPIVSHPPTYASLGGASSEITASPVVLESSPMVPEKPQMNMPYVLPPGSTGGPGPSTYPQMGSSSSALGSSSQAGPSTFAVPVPPPKHQPSPQAIPQMPIQQAATPPQIPQQPYMPSPPAQQPPAAVTPPGPNHYTHRPFVMPGAENITYPIIMAIDWGTTFSSMAYAFQQDGEVHEVSTWPKQTHSYPKVPTVNLYGPNSKEIVDWGYPAKQAISKPPFKHHLLLSKYKLHLDEASGPHPPLPNGLTVVDAIADYLRLFHAHVIQTVLKGFGANFEAQHIQYCLSVPAMWSDNAKGLMRQAALQAGMISPLDPPHRLLLISEPEAAALYCERRCDQFSLGHGQRFMICDAGGGTVDLIVFEVVVTPGGRVLKEVTRGSGHSCGSVFLDERMEALLRRRFAKWGDKGLSAANWMTLMENFIHNVKPLFDGKEDQYINMPAVPGRADLTDYDIGLEDGILTVTAEELRNEVFDPVVDDVLRLIQHQFIQTNYNCQAVFLVGGFGCSGYLYKRVQEQFGQHIPLIGVPPRAELAVVRGAAYAGLMPRTVQARVARRWYGVDSLMAFEHGADMPHKLVRDREGVTRARDRFSVYVSPGQQIGIDECITKRYVTYQYPNPVNSPLYACSSPQFPRYVDDPSVEKIGDFVIPLPHIPGARPGHKVMFELRMFFGQSEIRAEASVNGMVFGTRCRFE